MDRDLSLFDQTGSSVMQPVVTFADWRAALAGYTAMVAAEPVMPRLVLCDPAPSLAAAHAQPLADAIAFWTQPPQERRGGRLSRRVGGFIARTQAKQTFAGIAVLVMLLIWAI